MSVVRQSMKVLDRSTTEKWTRQYWIECADRVLG